MAAVTALWRHPIKSHGREALDRVTLTKGQTMPWDRHWAVTHEATKFQADAPKWEKCRNFMIGSQNPGVAGIWSSLDENTGTVTLRHSKIGELSFQPDTDAGQAAFLEWVKPIYPKDKRTATGIISNAPRGMTDTPEPTISIMNTASHAAVETFFGHPVSTERWRGNIWIDGAGAWDELNWIGKTIRVGGADLAITAPVIRCMATAASPETGERDLDTLGALRDGWDHQIFGVYAEVIKTGDIAVHDTYEVL